MKTTIMTIKTTNDHVFGDDLIRDCLSYEIVAKNVLFV